MFLSIKNQNYGYSVATYGDYVAVANPAITRFTFDTASLFQTGSVDYYRYNKNTDQHDFIGQLFFNTTMNILLCAESSSVPSLRDPLHTELNNTGSSANKDLEIDKNDYTSSFEDGFGLSLDMYGTILVAGSPYFLQGVQSSASLFTTSGSVVDIFDLGLSQVITSSATASNTFVFSIDNPDTSVTESFGRSVAINNSWIAVGSPGVSGSNGMVYIYTNNSSGSTYEWDLFQKIEPSGSSVVGPGFGWSVKLNKQSGSYSGSLVVGCSNLSSNQVFYFEFVSGSWKQTYIFNADTTTTYPLTFGNYTPYVTNMNTASGYGYSVSTFGTTVVVGEYLDRSVYEFSGSSLYDQGSVYVYERCPTHQTLFNLVLKTYGTSSILKNNQLGFSVDVFANNIIAGIPKTASLTSCYVGGTLEQLNQCPDTLDNSVSGQAMLLQKNTSSGEWGITNIYQRKKKYLSPYRDYGYSVAIDGRSMVVGAPMFLLDTNREIDLTVTQSNGATLDDVSGKGYIYNLANLHDQFHVGNVFYRNGKIVLMTSGSVFDGLFFNPVNANNYQYDLSFKGQSTIFEKQVVCSVNPGEFNVSTNPTAVIVQTSSLDINQNSKFDFQDIDVLLRYMQYKNTTTLGVVVSTDWSSSIVTTDDEESLLNYYQTLPNYNAIQTSVLASESIVRFETVDTWMQNVLDFNQDNKIDIRDMNILWKYFTRRLTQANYATFITPASQLKLFSDIVDHMDFLSQRNAIPQINPQFLTYEQSVATDKTGSFLAPVVTTIALYDGLDIVAVAKLGNPIKITPELPINFVVKMDW